MTPPTDTHGPGGQGTNGTAPSDDTGRAPSPPHPQSRLPHPHGPKQRADASCCSPSGGRSAGGEDRVGAGWLLLLLMPLCCAGPLLVGAIAAAGAAAWGALGGAVALAVGVALVTMVRRARRRFGSHPSALQTRSRAAGDVLR